MQKRLLAAAAILISSVSCSFGPKTEISATSTASVAENGSLEHFALSDVRLLDSPFKHAQQTNIQYLLDMEPDRLLAPYLREAGLEPKAPGYGNWESTGLDGHIGGHYLSALSMSYAATGDERLLKRLNYMISELARAQEANGTGYLGGVPDGEAMWAEISDGKIEADLFTLNGKWVPWYNIHKVYAGLRDAYLNTGNEQAKAMLIDLSDWALHLVKNLSDEQIQTMLRTEYGGMNEVFADVAVFTGDKRYLELAKKFSDQRIHEPLTEEQDKLTGLHANTQIPKVIGFKRIAEVAKQMGDGQADEWHESSEFFWETVVHNRTVAIGGNSVREHFHESDDFSSMVSDIEGPETCNTYNMIRLSKMLYSTSGATDYVDYYERALYNHILSSQHPDHGGLVYFTSMRPGHYRMYSQPDDAMWCCVGSGIENHGKYGEFIYAHQGDELFVNLFIPSRLNWREQGVVIEQQSNLPDSDEVTFTVSEPGDFALNLRYPRWVEDGALELSINGERHTVQANPGDYVRIDRQWQAGDKVQLSLPMHIELEQLPDESDHYAVTYGPVVLAAKTQPFPNESLNFLSDDSRMGHIAQGPTCPAEAAPLFVSDTRNFEDKFQRLPGEELAFKADGVIQNIDENVVLIPFFRVHDARYVVYWPYSTPERLDERKKAAAEQEKAERALEAVTIDKVAPGEQQPESDHFFKGDKTEAGIHRGRHWRHATGWFSYELKDPKREAKVLRITYYGLDAGRNFDILMNDEKLATVALDGSQGDKFYTVDYAVPASVWKNAKGNVLVTKFAAHSGSTAGGIYGVRLLKEGAPPGTP
jgi:DUF1680 family protein